MTASWPPAWTRAIGGSSTPPVLGMYVLPTIPTVGASFKDTALREQCVADAGICDWTQLKVSIQNFKILTGRCHTRQTLWVSLLIKTATYQSGGVCLFLLSLPALCVYKFVNLYRVGCQFTNQHYTLPIFNNCGFIHLGSSTLLVKIAGNRRHRFWRECGFWREMKGLFTKV